MQALQFFGAFIVVERKQIGGHMVWRKVVGEGGPQTLRLALAQGFQLFASFHQQLVFVNRGCGRRGGFGHGCALKREKMRAGLC
jgi:hypothetical protein